MPGLPRGLFWDLKFCKIQERARAFAFFGFQDRALPEQKNRHDRLGWKGRRTRRKFPRQNHERACIRRFLRDNPVRRCTLDRAFGRRSHPFRKTQNTRNSLLLQVSKPIIRTCRWRFACRSCSRYRIVDPYEIKRPGRRYFNTRTEIKRLDRYSFVGFVPILVFRL